MLENATDRLLSYARTRAARLRFVEDEPCFADSENAAMLSRANEIFYQDSIEVSTLLTPDLWKRFCSVCDKLEVPKDLISIFVYSSSEVQGECYSSGGKCIIRFSSALVNLLDEHEFEFVAGHEIGHFLLSHSAIAAPDAANLEHFRQRRSQEISVDRIGLVACGSIETALRALMKTISGLTAKHLRFDVGAFVSQLRRIETPQADLSMATHPSIVIRAKALLWFSLSEYFQKGASSYDSEQFAQIDRRNSRDLDRFMDGTAKARIAMLMNDVLLWMAAVRIAKFGSFSSSSQDQLRTMLEAETVDKLRAFLSSHSRTSIEAVVAEKLEAAKVALAAAIPRQYASAVQDLERTVSRFAEGLSP